MTEPHSFMKGLHHFFGVVEDRNDPEQTGRVRVRVMGFHTEDRTKLPTENLPWTPVLNSTGPSVSGIGVGPAGLVEGTWVLGVWLDHEEHQIPIVLGSLSAKPDERPDYEKGFSDPNKIYPIEEELEQADLPKLARAEAEEDPTLVAKREGKDLLGEVPTAVGSSVETVQQDKVGDHYERQTWEEPNPRYGDTDEESAYPFNQVRRSESGHTEEWDDTPDAERLHRYHAAGTFEEIQADGTRITKVVGDDYEIVIKDKNLLVAGNMNITVTGDAKILVQGNKYEEVDGDYFLTIRGDHLIKVVGNESKEVLTNQSTHVDGERNEYVGLDKTNVVIGNHTEVIVGKETFTVGGDESILIVGNETMTVLGNETRTIAGSHIMTVASTYTLTSTGALSVTTLGAGSITATGPLTLTGVPISLNP